MDTLTITPLPYCPDGADLFERLLDLPGAVFLDSAHPHTHAGRFDIMSAAPVDVGVPTTLHAPEQLAGFIAAWRSWLQHRGAQAGAGAWPFAGGLLGYFSYDLGLALHDLGQRAGNPGLPLAELHYHPWAVMQDHQRRLAVLLCQPEVSVLQRSRLLRRLATRTRPQRSFTLRHGFVGSGNASDYLSRFQRVADYIAAGDCYQVNLACHFAAAYQGDPWAAYRILRQVAAAPFSAYLDLHTGAALCVSPERFMNLRDGRVETRPIKGTRPRHAVPAIDRAAAEALLASEKDRAENLMIVDLLRNDLGRSCVPGSIRVDQLFALESYATVHHLVSAISGQLRPECDVFDLLLASFPGGSITGAPKRRAMQIIDELETAPRRLYCGSILYLGLDGRMDSNIAIRTMMADEEHLYCWGGGGLVADSDGPDEYREIADKVGGLMAALERAFD